MSAARPVFRVRMRFDDRPGTDLFDVELPAVPRVGERVNMRDQILVVADVYWNADPRIPADVVLFVEEDRDQSSLSRRHGDLDDAAARVLLDNMSRAAEVRGYAAHRDVDLADAIVELVNSGLSHQ